MSQLILPAHMRRKSTAPICKHDGTDDARRRGSTATVTIACKLPHGIKLELNPGKKDHRYVILAGTRTTPMGTAGLTEVPKDFWDAWHKKHKDLSFVEKGLVTVHVNHETALAHSVDNAMQKNGLEPLDMSEPNPEWNPIDPETGKPKVQVDTDRLRELGINQRVA